jgi:type I restriction enzyme R subunit
MIKKSSDAERVSILEDVDFELELIHKDDINVTYILKLLTKYNDSTDTEQQNQRQNIINIINANPQLRSKRELIERFINEYLVHIEDIDTIEDEFEKFWERERVNAFTQLCDEENLIHDETKKIVDTYLYDQRQPLKDDIAKTLKTKPKLLERKTIVPRVLDKIMGFIEKFYDR